MSREISSFRTPADEDEYMAAYDEALKLWPIPYEEEYVLTRFGITHVIVSGPKGAPALVLFHPAGCGAIIWYRNVEAFSQHYRIYAVDVIGEVNKSVVTHRIRSRQELADWVEELLKGLQIDKADIVGNSFGGFLAFNTALLLPGRVGKVVLISPAATFAQMWSWGWYFIPAYGTGWKPLLRKAFDWIWQDFDADDCISNIRQLAGVNGVPRHIPPSIFSDEELRKVSTPVLLLIGDREVIYKPETAIRRATRLVPGLQAEVIPNANHNAEYTAPEQVNKKVMDFLLS